MKLFLSELFSLFQTSYRHWSTHHSPLLAAGLAYYTIFSLAPLLVVSVSVAGLVFKPEAVSSLIVSQIRHVVNPQAAEAILNILSEQQYLRISSSATLISLLAMVIGASIMFAQLKHAINFVWGIAPQPGQHLGILIRTHFLSTIIVLTIAFLLLALMFVTTLFVAIEQQYHLLPDNIDKSIPQADFGIVFAGFAILFTLIFKLLPDAKLSWRDAVIGAIVTSLLFTMGEFFIGILLGWVSRFRISGAASTIFILLIWVYNSMQIILYGAAFTSVFAQRYGSGVCPTKNAARVTRTVEML